MDQDIAILQIIQAKGLGHKTLRRLLAALNQQRCHLEEFVSTPAPEITRRFGLDIAIAQAIESARGEAEQLSDEIRGRGVRILIKGMPGYPSRLALALGDTAPSVLFVKGNVSILERKSVAFCGSRKASEKALQVAADCAAMLAEEGVNVVSGYAQGVDMAAHHAALRAQGVTTLVLAEGISHFTVKREVSPFLTGDNTVVVSEFPPRMTWIARNAMQRNRTVCGLSDMVILVESRLSGGTFEAGRTAIQLRRPLFVVEYANPSASAGGNAYFLSRGARALRGNRQGKPVLKHVFDLLEKSNDFTPQGLPQSSLFDESDHSRLSPSEEGSPPPRKPAA